MFLTAILVRLLTSAEIQVNPDQVLNRISDDMYGSCIEDVNHEIYGGLYAQRIFGESFEEPGDVIGEAGWRALGGTWRSVGDRIEGSAGEGPMLVLQGKSISDGTVEARLQVANDQSGCAGLILRVRNPSLGIDKFDGYEIAFQAKTGMLALSRHRHDFRPLAQAPVPIATGEFHLIRAVLKGPKIEVFLDQEASPRISFTDIDTPILSGSIALRPWQADCSFRDININGETLSPQLQIRELSGMWDPVGSPRFHLSHDAFNGRQCQEIVNSAEGNPVGIANRGLNRWGISVNKGATMEGRIALRGTVGSATVALQSHDGRRTYASQTLSLSNTWRNTRFQLRSSVTNADARFAVLIDKPGSLFVDEAVLLDGDPYQGLPTRADIAQAMVSENLTFLRYGGTMVNVPGYRWKYMRGDPSLRPPYRGNWYPYSTNGFGIFDFLKFCEAAHFRSAFAINIEETPEDAADLAEYLSGTVTSKWGARRAADGHPGPYHPEYIEIGNEEGIGGSRATEMPHYAERFRLLERAIHERDPSLKLVCAAWYTAGSPDMKTVFDAVDGRAAAWDIHVGSDDPTSGVAVDRELTDLEHSFKSWNPRSGLKVVIFEENGGLHNQQRALGHATTVNATRRHGDFVLADCPANCLQPWQQNDNGWDQGQIFFTQNQVWSMPPAYAQTLLSHDREPLRVASTSPPGLDVLATRDSVGKAVVLTVVNPTSLAMSSTIALKRFRINAASARCLAGPLAAENSPKSPKRFVTGDLATSKRGDLVEITFPAFSVTSVRLVGSLEDASVATDLTTKL